MQPAGPSISACICPASPIFQAGATPGYHRVVIFDLASAAWREAVRSNGSIEQDRRALAHLIEVDADPAEIEYYESFSDPQKRLIDKAQRTFAGQFERRLRRRAQRARHEGRPRRSPSH
jgi:hypothetical protein